MDWLRKIVSGKRKRFVDENYNLDVTYITDRVLAMSFPASGLETMYRNSMGDVVNFLKKKHPNNFRVFNMSGRQYDDQKFRAANSKVIDFPWEDHHSPAIHILFQACQLMYSYLQEDNQNVVVVHCNAGKGRTGTLISCFLIYSGLAENAKDAIMYYGYKRFTHGKGVTQPSQIRYVEYFEKIYKGIIRSPSLKSLSKIIIHTIPDVSGSGRCKPYVEVVNGVTFEVIFHNKDSLNLISHQIYDYSYEQGPLGASAALRIPPKQEQKMPIQITNDYLLSSDLYFRIKHKGSFKNKLICRFACNPAFLDASNILRLSRDEVDPDSIQKDSRFAENFRVEVHFESRCPRAGGPCRSDMECKDLCSKCKSTMDTDIKGSWDEIHKILRAHKFPSHLEGVQINFRATQSDYEVCLEKAREIVDNETKSTKSHSPVH